jgi:hypothetical protein
MCGQNWPTHNCDRRNGDAISATAIWTRTAFSEAPKNFWILSACLTHRMNISIAQRSLSTSAIFLCQGLRMSVRGHKTFPDRDTHLCLTHLLGEGTAAVFGLARRQVGDPADRIAPGPAALAAFRSRSGGSVLLWTVTKRSLA